MLNPSALMWLEARGLDAETVSRLGVESTSRGGPGDWLAIPYLLDGRIVNRKYRRIDEKVHAQDKGGIKCFWNIDVLRDTSLTGPVVITEGEWDAMAAIQAGHVRTVSVPDGAPAEAHGEDDSGAKYSYMRDAIDLFRAEKEIILCTDGDGPGINLMNDLAIRLGRHRCKWVKYPVGCKDLNEALLRFGVKGVQETIKRAQWVHVPGVYRMSELAPVPNFTPHEIGMEALDDRYRVRFCDFTLVTGIPSHGKSTWVNDVCCRLADRYKWTIAFASFEQHPQIDHRRALRRWFSKAPLNRLTDDEIEAADKWIDERFVFLVPSEDEDADLRWVLERLAVAAVQHGAKVLVIDPWNELDHARAPDQTLTEYVGWAIREFKRFARKYQIHLIVVAHPAKMRKNDNGEYGVPSLYDVSDSAHWYNKPDVGIVVHRLNEVETLVRVSKSRYHEIIGKPGDEIFNFNSYTGRYQWIPEEARGKK